MERHFFEGDSLSFKEYFKIWNNPVRFHSVLKWFVFITLKTSIFLIGVLAIMAFFAWIANSFPSNHQDILCFFGWLFAGVFILVWTISFYQSFILPKIIANRVLSFIREYLPQASGIEREEADTFFFNWRGNTMAISYKENVSKIADNRTRTGYRKVVDKYIKVSTIFFHEEDDFYDEPEVKREPLYEGINMVQTDFDVFVTFRKGKRFFQKDVTSALERLIKTSAQPTP